MGEQADGSWAAGEIGLIASRQNGKNGAVEARELFGLTVLGEWIIHTAHLFKTTKESYDRLLALLEAHPDTRNCLASHVASPASGYEMKFHSGGRIIFIARSKTSGRGMTGDLLVLDEAQDLNDDALGALLPVISARPGSQAWYQGSAPGLSSSVFHRIRKRIRSGKDERFAGFEFSADPDSELDDESAWAQANPAYGDRITRDAVLAERGSMSDEMFARERLSISPDIDESSVLARWADVCDPGLEVTAQVFAVDMNPERSLGAIVAASREGPHVELVDVLPGAQWLVDRACELAGRYRRPFALDKTGPAGALIPELQRRGVRVIAFDTADVVKACGRFADLVNADNTGFRARTSKDLNMAVHGAVPRSVGDGAWAWGRKQSHVNIAPLVAATLAVHAAETQGRGRMYSMAKLLEDADGN